MSEANLKKRAYLINPPADFIVLRDMYSSTISKGSYNWPPADLLVTSGILKQSCEIMLKDANTEGLNHEQTINEIIDFNPEIVFSTFGNSVRENDYELSVAGQSHGFCNLLVKHLLKTEGVNAAAYKITGIEAPQIFIRLVEDEKYKINDILYGAIESLRGEVLEAQKMFKRLL